MAQDRDPSKPAGAADLVDDLLDDLADGVDAAFAPDLVMDASGELRSIDDGLTTIPDPTATEPSFSDPIEPSATEPLALPELNPRRLASAPHEAVTWPDPAGPSPPVRPPLVPLPPAPPLEAFSPPPEAATIPLPGPPVGPPTALDPFAGLQTPAGAPVPRLEGRCRVLVVSDDPTLGKALVERLGRLGAEGRTVRLAAVADAQGQTWDVLLVVVTTEEARRDGGRGRLRKLSMLPLPTVLLAPEPLAPPEAQVVACLEAPPLPEELGAALEAALRPSPGSWAEASGPVPSPVAPVPNPPAAGAAPSVASTFGGTPGDGQVQLDVNIVRALVLHGPEDRSRGRVRSLGRSGRLQVDLKRPIESGRQVQVRLVRPEGLAQVFSGRVVTATAEASTIQLDLTDDTGFVQVYLREAVDVTLPVPDPVTIEVQLVTEMEERVSDETLLARWAEVQTQLDDDAVQQAFIQECIKAQKLDLAVRCYRQLREAHPEDERVQKYLNQVGTILGFYALRREVASDETTGMSKRVKVVLGLFIGAAVFLVLIAFIVS